MTPTDLAFWLCAVLAVASGVAVFVVDSMARATYALATSFVATGLAVLLLQQSYLGAVIVLMMVMEMAVMAVYMVMFMGMNPALMPMSMVHSHRWAIGVSVASGAAPSWCRGPPGGGRRHRTSPPRWAER